MPFPYSLGGGFQLGGGSPTATAGEALVRSISASSVAAWGTDISTFPTLDPAFGLMSDRRVISEALARRYITERGTLVDDPNYGTDVRSYLNESTTNLTLSSAKSDLEKEAVKDERVSTAQATVSYDSPSSTLIASVSLETAAGPYVLVLAFTTDAVTIIRGA